MTRSTPRTVLHRAAGSFAAAGLLAAASLAGAAAPAQAADTPVFTLGGPAETALHPYPENGRPKSSTVEISSTTRPRTRRTAASAATSPSPSTSAASRASPT